MVKMRRFAALTVWLAVLPALAAPAAEDAADQVWLISTRSAPACGAIDASGAQFDYWRLGPDQEWSSADLKALLAADDPGAPTTIYVHGNRANADKAIREAWPVYRCLKEHSAGRRFRFVIWSWPSDRIKGRNLQDLRVKAARSDAEALYMAWHLDRVRPDVPVNLVGFSFGARVITGALEILAGGESAGYALPQRSAAPRRKYRAMLVAAAVDNDWLLPGHSHGLALGQVEHLLITENACDRALRWYPFLAGRRGPHALGFTGPAWLAGLGPARAKIELVGVSNWVGKVHDWRCYLSAPELLESLPAYAFLDSSGKAGGPGRSVIAEVPESGDARQGARN